MPSIQDIFFSIWAERRRIFLFCLAVGVMVLGISFLLPVYYKSTAVLLPETEGSKLGSMGQFAGIAALAGIDIPGGDVSRLYPVIAHSEAVLGRVIQRRYDTEEFAGAVNLIEYFELEEDTPEEDYEKALKELRNLMETRYDGKTKTVSLTLEMKESDLSADVLNALVEELDRFMREERTTSASEQARWIGDRLEEIEMELQAAEDSLKEFREKNRRVIDSPDLLLQQARLQREVTVKSTIFVELKKQRELAEIEEIKNVSIVNVLDHARAPVKKSRPRRAMNSLIGVLLALIGSSAFYGLKPHYGGQVRDFVQRLKSSGGNRPRSGGA
jgi:uncharacterized protein involved in exopolysaccharide biosynthesis